MVCVLVVEQDLWKDFEILEKAEQVRVGVAQGFTVFGIGGVVLGDLIGLGGCRS